MSIKASLLRFLELFAKAVERSVIITSLPGVTVQVEAPNLLVTALLQAFTKFSWLGVRSMGNLQLLTKASYVSLLVVPLIAGIWPFIRNMLNRYNETVEEAATNTLTAATVLSGKLEELKSLGEGQNFVNPLLSNEIEKISIYLEEIAQNFTYLVHDTNMPASFAYAFLASLSVAVGHLLYEAFCPQAVKDFEQSNYTTDRLRRY